MAGQSLASVSQAWGSASGWDGGAWYAGKSLSFSAASRREGMVAGPDAVCRPFSLELCKTHRWVCARPKVLSQRHKRPAGHTARPHSSRRGEAQRSPPLDRATSKHSPATPRTDILTRAPRGPPRRTRCSEKQASRKRTNAIRFHFCEVPRTGKFTETESGLVAAGGRGREKRAVIVRQVEFRFRETNGGLETEGSEDRNSANVF